MILTRYVFSSQTIEPPTGNQVRLDTAVLADVTRVWIRNLSDEGVDLYHALTRTPIGAWLFLQDWNDHAHYCKAQVVAAPVDKVEYVELAVAVVEASGTPFNNTQTIAVAIAAPGDLATDPGTPPVAGADGPPLLTLEDAKLHLRITTTSQDADVEAKLAEASDIVRDYLKARNDPLWTSATAPRPIVAAVKLMLTHLWEHRGDDPATDEALWMAIDRLVIRFRDPAYA